MSFLDIVKRIEFYIANHSLNQRKIPLNQWLGTNIVQYLHHGPFIERTKELW
jgi:hypothetical protein